MPTNVEPIDTAGLKDLISKPKDKPLLVNFWATYCDPCRDEFPDLVKVDTDFRPKSLDFVTVSLDDVSDIKTTVPQFLAQMKATIVPRTPPKPSSRKGSASTRSKLPKPREAQTIDQKEAGKVMARASAASSVDLLSLPWASVCQLKVM